MTAPDISILIVSWNVRELLLQCLAALPAAVGDGLRYEVIVVDNASGDGTVAAVQAAFPGVTVIANADNRGFTGGNNQALAAARGDYLFLLNPDTVPDPGSIAELWRYLAANPGIGIVGPRLRYPDGATQSSRRRFPTLPVLFTESTIVQEYLPGLRLFDRFYMADQADDTPQIVDWIVGAAMFVRRQVYDEIGGLDEGFFMYSEELDWCKRAVAAGWQVGYDPAAEIIHHEGKSSEQVVAEPPYPFLQQPRALHSQVSWRVLGRDPAAVAAGDVRVPVAARGSEMAGRAQAGAASGTDDRVWSGVAIGVALIVKRKGERGDDLCRSTPGLC